MSFDAIPRPSHTVKTNSGDQRRGRHKIKSATWRAPLQVQRDGDRKKNELSIRKAASIDASPLDGHTFLLKGLRQQA